MRTSHAFAGLAALVFMAGASIALAQTETPPTPPTTEQPAQPPAPPPAPPTPAAPATPSTPATPPAAEAASTTAPQGCRTQKPAGEACACLSDPSRIGESTAHPAGHTVCVRPD